MCVCVCPSLRPAVRIPEAHTLHSWQVEWEELRRGDRLAGRANERMQSLLLSLSLSSSLLSLPPQLFLKAADRRTLTQTLTNRAEPVSSLDWTSRRGDGGGSSPSHCFSIRSAEWSLLMFALSLFFFLSTALFYSAFNLTAFHSPAFIISIDLFIFDLKYHFVLIIYLNNASEWTFSHIRSYKSCDASLRRQDEMNKVLLVSTDCSKCKLLFYCSLSVIYHSYRRWFQ